MSEIAVSSKSKTRVSVSLLQPEKKVENTRRRGIFWTNLDDFGNVVKHPLQCLIYVVKRNYKENR